MNQRHFAKGFEFDRRWNRRWPPGIQFAPTEGLCPFLQFSLCTVLWLRIGGCGPWVLLLSRLDGLLEFFCFPWRCPVLFRLDSLVSLCHVRLVNIVGRCWLVRWCELVSDFSLSNCNLCSAHGREHADTQVAVVGSFSFACHATTRFWNKTTETKTSETPVFPNLKFCFCDFWNALNVMQKPSRNRSRVTSLGELNSWCGLNFVWSSESSESSLAK